MIKNILLGSLIVFVGASAFAVAPKSVPLTVTCKPVVKFFPFEKFTLKLDDSSSKLDLVFSKDADYWNKEDRRYSSSTGQKNGLEIDKNEVLIEDGRIQDADIEVGTDILTDWAGTTIQIRKDDAGLAAFVRFVSDGPTILAFYRCEAELR